MAGPWEEYQQTPSTAEAGPAPWEEYREPAQPQGGLVPSQREMQQAQGQAELEQALRTPGMTPEQIRRMGLQAPAPVSSTLDADNQAAIDYYQRGGQQSPKFDLPPRLLGPDGQPSNPGAAVARSAGDTLSYNFLDELEAFVETGSFSGEEYEAAWRRRQQRRAADSPVDRVAGTALGVAGSMLLPAGVLSKVKGFLPQTAAGIGLGAGMTALGGYGAAAPGEGAPTLVEDLAFGAGFGAFAPAVAGVARTGAQVLGARPQSAAVDALESARVDPAELRRLAEEFYNRNGYGARLIDLIPNRSAAQLTKPLNRSAEAADRVIADLVDTRNALPQNMQQSVTLGVEPIGPTRITTETTRRGDQEFSAFRETPVELDDDQVKFFAEEVLPNVSLKQVDMKRIAAPIRAKAEAELRMNALIEKMDSQSGKRPSKVKIEEMLNEVDALRKMVDKPVVLTGGDLDMLRQSLRANDKRGIGRTLRPTAEAVEDTLVDYIPEAGDAIANYRAGMRQAEGAELGQTVRTAGTTDFAEQSALLDEAGELGRGQGVVSSLSDEAMRGPSQSYRLAKQLEEDPGFAERLRMSLPEGQADEMIAFATQTKKSLDNLAAASRIPPEKVENLLDDIDGMTNFIAGLGFGAGGAFKAALIRSVLAKTTTIGAKAADSLADMLLDPAMRETAIKALERAGGPRLGLREIVQSAFISTGAAMGSKPSDNAMSQYREPEGVPAPQETVTIGVPQQ